VDAEGNVSRSTLAAAKGSASLTTVQAPAGPTFPFPDFRIANCHLPVGAQQQARHIAGAARQIDDAATQRATTTRQRALPQAVDAKAHEVVHQIVARRNGSEDAPNQRATCVAVHLLAAKALIDGRRWQR
jgi:hypothetical protein